MKSAKVYSLDGQIVKEMELPLEVFDKKVNPDLIHQALVAHFANHRQVLAHTKERAEVRGGGRKPWRQKHTGRARHGSIRSPLWRGGGITFGPLKSRNFSVKINKKMKRKALCMALTDKLEAQNLIFVEDFKIDKVKTKKVVEILKALGIENKRVLIILPEKDEKIYLSIRNIDKLSSISADHLNIKDVLDNQVILMPIASIEVITETYLK